MANGNQQQPRQSFGSLMLGTLPWVGITLILLGILQGLRVQYIDMLSRILFGTGLLLFLSIFLRTAAANLKHYINVGVYSALVVGICVVLYLFAEQYSSRIDLTEQKTYSLAPASRQYLQGMEEEVTITIFTTEVGPFAEWMKLYAEQTGKLKWEFIDAIREPLVAAQFGEGVSNGDLFVHQGQNAKKLSVTELDENHESVLINAIVQVSRGDKPKIYFVTGHGEVPYYRDLKPNQGEEQERLRTSVVVLRKFLTDRGMETAQLDIAQTGKVPDDATAVVMIGPAEDISSAEGKALHDYLRDRAGSLLLAMKVRSTELPIPHNSLDTLLDLWGLRIDNHIILDLFTDSLGESALKPMAAIFDPGHPISRDLASMGTARFPLMPARPVFVAGDAPNILKYTPVIQSSANSFTMDQFEVQALSKQGRNLTPPPQEQRAPQTIALAVEQLPVPRIPGMAEPPASADGPRIVVFGGSEIMEDGYMSQVAGAQQIMLNAINWLTEREDLIAIPPKSTAGTPIVVTAAQIRMIFMFTTILVPGVMFFGGVTYSIMRRRR